MVSSKNLDFPQVVIFLWTYHWNQFHALYKTRPHRPIDIAVPLLSRHWVVFSSGWISSWPGRNVVERSQQAHACLTSNRYYLRESTQHALCPNLALNARNSYSIMHTSTVGAIVEHAQHVQQQTMSRHGSPQNFLVSLSIVVREITLVCTPVRAYVHWWWR